MSAMRKSKRLLTSIICIFLLAMPFGTIVSASEDESEYTSESVEPSSFELHVLDVGQGLSILVKANDSYLLYDGGGRQSSSYVVSYLKKQGISSLDYIVTSHYDEDHISGLVGVLNVFDCETVLAPDYEADSKIYASYASAIAADDAALIHPKQGDRYAFDNAVITVVGPSSYDNEIENNRCVAIRIEFGHTSYLLCGDAQEEEEDVIVNSELDINSDVYVVNHHGSSSSSGFYFLNAVHPTYAILSCSEDNSYGHPALSAMERLQAEGVELFRTDKQGEIICYSDGTNIEFNTDACNDFSGREQSASSPDASAFETTASADNTEYTYVCNINSFKFHRAYCDSVDRMKEANKRYTNESRDVLISQGYVPCQNCNP